MERFSTANSLFTPSGTTAVWLQHLSPDPSGKFGKYGKRKTTEQVYLGPPGRRVIILEVNNNMEDYSVQARDQPDQIRHESETSKDD